MASCRTACRRPPSRTRRSPDGSVSLVRGSWCARAPGRAPGGGDPWNRQRCVPNPCRAGSPVAAPVPATGSAGACRTRAGRQADDPAVRPVRGGRAGAPRGRCVQPGTRWGGTGAGRSCTIVAHRLDHGPRCSAHHAARRPRAAEGASPAPTRAATVGREDGAGRRGTAGTVRTVRTVKDSGGGGGQRGTAGDGGGRGDVCGDRGRPSPRLGPQGGRSGRRRGPARPSPWPAGRRNIVNRLAGAPSDGQDAARGRHVGVTRPGRPPHLSRHVLSGRPG
jgi:hypothetical protein